MFSKALNIRSHRAPISIAKRKYTFQKHAMAMFMKLNS